MSAIPAPERIALSPGVSAILEANTSNARLLRDYLRFTDAILARQIRLGSIES